MIIMINKYLVVIPTTTGVALTTKKTKNHKFDLQMTELIFLKVDLFP